MAEEIKDRLKALRCKLNIKQREVAERLGVRVGLVGNWESGVAAIPSTRIYQLCHEYNVRREWLETGEGEMFEPGKTREQQLDDAIDLLFNGLNPELQRAFVRVARKHCGMSAIDEAKILKEIDEKERGLNEQIKRKPR